MHPAPFTIQGRTMWDGARCGLKVRDSIIPIRDGLGKHDLCHRPIHDS